MRYIIIAYFFLFVQELRAQQYPFVHYTPKDGLVNIRCRKAFQDSKGRMYFITYAGLSVYDGSKFTNYTTEQGLCNNVVNDVYEAGPDSLLVATNGGCLNTLVHGKIGTLNLNGGSYPNINEFLKSENGKLYLLSDDGLFVLNHSQLIREPIPESNAKTFKLLHLGFEWRNYLMLAPWDTKERDKIFLYDKEKQQLVHSLPEPIFFDIAEIYDGVLIATTNKGQFIIDTSSLKLGKLLLQHPPPPFNRRDILQVYRGRNNTSWLYTHNQVYQYKNKLLHTIIHPQLPVRINNITKLFVDRENILWILTDGGGIYKFPNTDIQILESSNNENFSFIYSLYGHTSTDTVWLYQFDEKKLVYHTVNGTGFVRIEKVSSRASIFSKDGQPYLIVPAAVYRIPYPLVNKSSVTPILVYPSYNFKGLTGKAIIDPFGNLILLEHTDTAFRLVLLIKNKPVSSFTLNSFADGLGFDSNQNLWVVTRLNDFLQLRLHPEEPNKYFELVHNFKNDFGLSNPRSLLVDKNNGIWVGTRYDGLYYFQIRNSRIISHNQFSTQTGMTDNFVSDISGDNLNNIWVGTQSGIDKISWRDERWIIENVTKNNNIFQTVVRTVVDKSNTVWGLTNTGSIIKINPRQHVSAQAPPLHFTSIKVAGEQLDDSRPSVFRHDQNNLTFSVAAASFIDEKSIQYSYLLRGSVNEQWNEEGNSSTFNFSNLAPGKYDLNVKATFPGVAYPPQITSYSFTILPPYWETWWFRVGIIILIIAIAILLLRNYFKRKLEKERVALEKQQAVEKERTRIATDIHDDLGSGLSRIRYLGEMVKDKTRQQQNIISDIEKISEFSDDMVDKMNEIVWALNEKNDTLAALIYYTRSFAVAYLSDNNLQCKITIPEEIPIYNLNGENRRNIFLAVKESLHNIVKHAEATEASLTITIDGNITIDIHDNGKGIDWDNIRLFSNGVTNIRKRMEEVQGHVIFTNSHGTNVQLIIPLL